MTSRRTDDSENMEVRGMITILPDSNNGDGSIEVSGKVYADAIQSNTTSSGVLIEDMLIKGSTVVIKKKDGLLTNFKQLINILNEKELLFLLSFSTVLEFLKLR